MSDRCARDQVRSDEASLDAPGLRPAEPVQLHRRQVLAGGLLLTGALAARSSDDDDPDDGQIVWIGHI